jgi:transcriptional regulator with XRE-family HTH domain
MSLSINLQNVLRIKFQEKKLKRKDFISQSGINPTTTNKIIGGNFRNPSLKTLLKLANYFNCHLDEVIGRDKKYYTVFTNNYKKLTEDEINTNLKKLIKDKIQETGLSAFQLAIRIGCSQNTIFNFLDDKREQKTLGSPVMVALANYFQLSIDEMIGRIAIESLNKIPKDINSH